MRRPAIRPHEPDAPLGGEVQEGEVARHVAAGICWPIGEEIPLHAGKAKRGRRARTREGANEDWPHSRLPALYPPLAFVAFLVRLLVRVRLDGRAGADQVPVAVRTVDAAHRGP